MKACFRSITYDVVAIPIYRHYYVTSRSSSYPTEICSKMLCYDWLTQNTEFRFRYYSPFVSGHIYSLQT